MSKRDAYDALVLAASENGRISVTIIDAIVAYAAAIRADEKARCIAAVDKLPWTLAHDCQEVCEAIKNA